MEASAKDGEVTSEKGKAQAVAQSLTSLGNLYVEMGDEEGKLAAEADGSAREAHVKAKTRRYEQALTTLERAKEQYIRGFSQSHPKVAWALEGLARVYQKHGMFKRAEETWEEAIAIRNQLQESASGKELFSSELAKAAQAKGEIEQLRANVRKRFSRGGRKLRIASLVAAGGVAGSNAQPLLET